MSKIFPSGKPLSARLRASALSRAEYKIYSSVLQKYAAPDIDRTYEPGSRPTRLFVAGSTVSTKAEPTLEGLDEAWFVKNNYDRHLCMDFLKSNRTSHRLENRFDVGTPVILWTPPATGAHSFEYWQYWYHFRATRLNHCGTLCSLSRVGFNQDSRLALLYFGTQEHRLAGIGYLLTLEKQKNKWAVRDECLLWIS
jgi:hypothetical protein